MSRSWPKLSETLPYRRPGECQQCTSITQLTYWRECDESDRETPATIVLCKRCADQIIEPHPRLYVEQSLVQPLPGAMVVCATCRARSEMTCKSPLATFNGGPGLEYEPKGSMVHICRSPRSHSGWIYSAPGPVYQCSGKDAANVS